MGVTWGYWQLCIGSSPSPKPRVIGKSSLSPHLLETFSFPFSSKRFPPKMRCIPLVLTPRWSVRYCVPVSNGTLSLPLGMVLIRPKKLLPPFHLRVAFVSAEKAPSGFLNRRWLLLRLLEAVGGGCPRGPSDSWCLSHMVLYSLDSLALLFPPIKSLGTVLSTCPATVIIILKLVQTFFFYYFHFLWLSLWTRHIFKVKCFPASTCALNAQWSATHYHPR